MIKKYYSGQGVFMVSVRDADGQPMGFVEIGNVPTATIDLEVEKEEHKESMSGQRGVDVTVEKSKKARLSMTVENFAQHILALGLHGDTAVIAAGSVTDEPHTAYLGETFYVDVPKFATAGAAVVMKNATTPATVYVLGTDYTVGKDGGITIKPAGGSATITNGTKVLVSYAHESVAKLNAFSVSAPVRWVRFHGVNTVRSMEKKVVDIFKVQFDPIAGYGLISDEIQGLELNGDVLFDDLRPEGESNYMREYDLGVLV